jgi:predicted RND superfamily exporter protein
LRAVAEFCVRHPRKVLALALGGVFLSLGTAVGNLELRTSNLDLIDAELPPVQHFRQLAEEFGTPNVLVVVFEGNDPTTTRRAVDRLGPRLLALPGVRSVVDKLPIDPGALEILEIDPYLTSRDGGLLFLFVQPDDSESRAETLAPLVHGVRRELASARLDRLGVSAGLTGMPAYAVDDREVIEGDISRLSLVSFLLVSLLFAVAFGSGRRPLLVMVALVLAVGWMPGLIALYPGHLTLLSAFFASILFGLGVDFGIHQIARVEELVAAGRTELQAVPEATGSLATATVTSALTTSSVLLAMSFAGFKGFAELGVIAGFGVLLCTLAMITVLPALLALFGPAPGGERRLPERRLGHLLGLTQRPAVAWALALLVLFSLFFSDPGFDTDYLNLQPRGSEAVRLERLMVERSDWSPEVAVFTADSRREAKDLVWELVNDDTVGTVRSLLDFEALGGQGAGQGAATLHPALRASLLSPQGRYAIYVHPRGDIWDPAEQAAFLHNMKAIDPEVTGLPILGQFMMERSRHALRITAALGVLLLVLWVGIAFRRPLPALLAMLPALLTLFCLGALMRLCGIAFNPLNVMALPLVLGIAVDDGVHLVHRFLAGGGNLASTLASSGRSILLTSATTLAAFGSLAFSTHRGLASFALVTCLGVGAALILSLALLPELLRVLAKHLT